MKFTPRRGKQRAFKRPVAILQKREQGLCQWSIDYKNVSLLRKLITNEGKIIPRRITGMSAKQHRAIARAIKNARMAALLPFVAITPTHG